MNENQPDSKPLEAPEIDPLQAQWQRLFANFRRSMMGGRKPKLPYVGAKERGDGFDQDRIDAAKAKRERRRTRRLNEFHQ